MNKIFPQVEVNGKAAARTKVLPGEEAGCRPLCCSPRGACLSASLLFLLATLAALIALVAIFGSPPRTPAAQACVTLTNRTGFLCHDRRSCISASGVCDGIHTCPHGEDEDEVLCRRVRSDTEFGNSQGGHDSPPPDIPETAVARCGLPPASSVLCRRCAPESPPIPCGTLWRLSVLDLLRPEV
ncbi:low-density lipoprotein receptor class A domain-containing protein 1 isoform 3-T3 [Glossophaga mutica]